MSELEAKRSSRSRWWWLAAVLVAGSAAVFMVAASMPRLPDFEFLGGRESVERQLTEKELAGVALSNNNLEFRAYTFRADFKALEASADAELNSKAFIRDRARGLRLSGVAHYVRGSWITLGLTPQPTAKPPPRIESQLLTIYEDTRFSREFMIGPKGPGQDKGWVTVLIFSTPAPTLFERVGNWLGF